MRLANKKITILLYIIIWQSGIFLRDIIVEINQGVHKQARGHAPKLGDPNARQYKR